MRVQRRNVILATTAIASLVAGPAAAQESPVGPSSSSGANAAGVDGVATVSGTSADTAGDGSAEAAVVKLGDETVVGGSQEGVGSNGGEILTTGETDQGSITVGGWKADVEEGRSSSESSVLTAQSSSEDGPRVDVLRSTSDASTSESSASTTGARLSMGGHTLELLSAQSSSEGSGAAYLVSADGQAIGSSEQADGQCQIDANPLAELLCLYARAFDGEAGEGDDDGSTPAGSGISTGVLDVGLGDGALTGGLFTSTASAADDTGGPKPPTGTPEDDDPKPPAGDPGPNPAPDGPLPVTGGGIATSVLGLLSLAGAGALRRFTRG